MSTVYALLVGINEYVNVTALHGCVDDVTSIETLLKGRVGDALRVRTLLNAEATRANIIDGFRSHLAQATADDVALFYFCGHGSQEPCPPEWERLEPSGQNQTILPVDARANGIFEIADKELVALLHRVAEKGAHVLTIFDSCHSAGVTRGDDDALAAVTRMAPAVTDRARTLAEYLDDAVTLFSREHIDAHGMPEPRHVTLSACQHFETAKEWPLQPPRRGTFTRALEEVLAALGPTATYTDVLDSVRAWVLLRAEGQMPALSVSGGAEGSQLFLSGRAGRKDLSVVVDDNKEIWLSAGGTDGIVDPAGGSSTEVAIYARGALDGGSERPSPLAMATVAATRHDRARLQLVGDVTLDVGTAYVGVVTKLSAPQMTVAISGTPDDAVARVRGELSAASALYAVTDTPMPGIPSVSVVVSPDATALHDSAGVALRNQQFPHSSEGTAAMQTAVLHLTRWHGQRDRGVSPSSLNDAIQIDVIALEPGEFFAPPDRAALPVVDGVVAVHLPGGEPVGLQIRLRNRSPLRLYTALFDLSESFGCSVWFDDWIAGGTSAFAFRGEAFDLKLPAWKTGATECTDILRVFVAREAFTASDLQLPSLLNPKPAEPGASPATGAFRDIEVRSRMDRSTWGTTTLRLRAYT